MMLILRCTFVVLLSLAVTYEPTVQAHKVIINIGCKEHDLAANHDASDNITLWTDRCSSGKCACYSSFEVITNLTSNTIINITDDVVLSSTYVLKNFANISLIGHNGPTIKCNQSGGGLRFVSCQNCTIANISWYGCGTQTVDQFINPVIQFRYSSNIKIHNCSFENSVGQAIVVSEVMGGVIISYSKFVNNYLCRGDGAAIYYTSNEGKLSRSDINTVFLIDNCNFSRNSGALSVVYVGPSMIPLSLTNSVFYKNQGNAIYISSAGLNIDGVVMFEGNVAESGGSISVHDYANVKFCQNSTVLFSDNVATSDGGAIFMNNHVSILFEKDSRVLFHNNKAYEAGGAIFSNNNCYIVSEENSVVNFLNNSATASGGAMWLRNTSISFINSTITFNNNNAKELGGGAMLIDENCDVIVKGNSVINFDENMAAAGGAIYCQSDVNFKIQGSSLARFSSNNASLSKGGAIYMTTNCNIFFEQTSVVAFTNNTAEMLGGALFVEGCIIAFKDYSKVSFSHNGAINDGGAIYIHNYSGIKFDDKASVLFYANSAGLYGGSMYVNADCLIIFNNN